MKNILGLDLGTNSIGWAVVTSNDNTNEKPQVELGSRIIPMSQDVLGKFDSGVTQSQTAERTGYRGARRIRERYLLRRERLFRVLHILGFLPRHFEESIGWDKNDNKTYGKFKDDSEPKLAWDDSDKNNNHFIFVDSFNEMLEEFKKKNPSFISSDKKIPYDWTMYYLRDKATRQPISKQELAWIILNFNQKRGYYQLRGEDEEENTKHKTEEYYELRIDRVEATNEKRGNDIWYNIYLENGWVYRRSSRIPLEDWVGKKKEFIVTTEYNEDGSIKLDKDGNEKRSFRAPKDDDWGLQKKKTEFQIDSSEQTVGSFIYNHLLANPTEKIRGKVVRTIERKYYKQELGKILAKQKDFIPELSNSALLEQCIHELYANNTAHQDSLRKKDINYLIIDDIIFYQRPLKSKKSLIADCPYEQYEYINKNTGEIKKQHIKCIAKSNPYYQEFRIWQFIQNLRLYSNDLDNTDVTKNYLKNEEDYVHLFKYLNNLKEISQETLLKDFFSIKKPKGKDSIYPVRWNYVEDKKYPCNSTRYQMLAALKDAEIPDTLIDNRNTEYRLWHLLYSVEDRNELISALCSFARDNKLPESFVDCFKKIPSYKKEYGAYSEKAVKKLLSVMRVGSLWSEDNLPNNIHNVINGTIDEKVKKRIEHKGFFLSEKQSFRGLPEWLACYVVYGRHSETSDISRWETPQDLANFIHDFKQHSLRNPIVEQCILETLRTVHDIWVRHGRIDEIHVELGRSMKSTAEQRERMSKTIIQNENTNLRIKNLLLELKNDSTIKDVRPYSPMQQDLLRIYEEGALLTLKRDDKDYNEISRISKLSAPTQSELTRYKLWLEQRYRSPYTGKTISLSKLFTPAYQIEHVIPQGRYFDDSFSNKVICEAEVNQRKSNMLGYEFIQKCGGEIIHCATLGDVKVLTAKEYKDFVSDHYDPKSSKAQKLMMDDIPETFIQRQMNDTRYISKVIKSLLSNIVREKDEIDAISKNVIPCTGGITERLKNDWGLKHVWNSIVAPRFIRMNQLTNSEAFGHWENKDGKRVFQTTMPIELEKGFSKKRIDHRHHALDALVIALASRNIISYLNNESARDTNRREDLRRLLCDKNRIIRKPWNTFTQDAYVALQNIVVSFKNYVRVINKASNYYEHYDENGRKKPIAQKGEEQWAIRKPLHKETVFGQVNLQRKREVSFAKAIEQVSCIVDKDLRNTIKSMIKAGMDESQIRKHFKAQNNIYAGKSINKVEVYYYTDSVEPMVATRKLLDDSFDEKKILSITDTGIQSILLNYLEAKGNDPKLAFSPEGIMEMNENIAKYNNGKFHQPIIRVRVSEPKGEKYNIGTTKNKAKKFVEAQSGTNLFFAIYETENGNRSYKTIPFNQVVERMKMGWTPVPEKNENGDKLKFYLSPNELVYVPTEEERMSNSININKDRIYKMVSATGNQVFYVRHNIASVIENKVELQSLNKMEKTMEGEMIKSICWKLEVDRLGNITNIIR